MTIVRGTRDKSGSLRMLRLEPPLVRNVDELNARVPEG